MYCVRFDVVQETVIWYIGSVRRVVRQKRRTMFVSTHGLIFSDHLHIFVGQSVPPFLGPVIFRDRGKVAEFAELPT